MSQPAEGAATPTTTPGAERVPLRRLVVFFATVYAVQGFAQTVGSSIVNS